MSEEKEDDRVETPDINEEEDAALDRVWDRISEEESKKSDSD